MKEINKNRTERSRMTRMSIGEAIIELMEQKKLSDIRIARICIRAGVSRMTFYHYYETKEDALMDYLQELITIYMEESNQRKESQELRTNAHIVFAFEFFAQYSKFLLRLEKAGCYHILIDGVNQYLEENYQAYFKDNIYHLYFYAGALLNVFMKWLKNGRVEDVTTIAEMMTNY